MAIARIGGSVPETPRYVERACVGTGFEPRLLLHLSGNVNWISWPGVQKFNGNEKEYGTYED